jgi:hypothetical protein
MEWDSMNKNVNQVKVSLQQYINRRFRDVQTHHFFWEGFMESSRSILITRDETRMFYLYVLREDGRNPLYCFSVKYQEDNIEQSFSQYFTVCGRGTIQFALERVLKAVDGYPQDSEFLTVLNLFQSVYDKRSHSSGKIVKNSAKKRGAVEESNEISSTKKAKTVHVMPVSASMNQGSHLFQNSQMIFLLPPAVPMNTSVPVKTLAPANQLVPVNTLAPMNSFDRSDQLFVPFDSYYALPIQQESTSEFNNPELCSISTIFAEEKKSDVSTVVENKVIAKDKVFAFEQPDFEQLLDFYGPLDSIMSNPVSTQFEDTNQHEHSSTSECIASEFFLNNLEISTKVADLMLN